MSSDVPQELPARRGFTVSYLGKTLLSRIDPIAQGERLAAETAVKERTLYLCPSPLYAYGLSILFDKVKTGLTANNSAILCIEADDKLFEISKKALAEHKMPLIKASSPEQVCAFVRKTWGERVFRRLEVLHFSGGWQLFEKHYDDIEAALRQVMALEWGNAMTLIRLGRLYIRNLIQNLPLLPLGENIAALNFGSSPVLLLGAGPSLDTMLGELAAVTEKTVIGKRHFAVICVDTCLPALHERGIVPDLVIILESQHWNLKDFCGASGRKVDAVIDLSALPASTRVLGGKRFLFATPWTSLALFGRLEKAALLPQVYTPLGSVGLSAAAMALNISSGPVFLSGMDFSFTVDSYHARATPGHSNQLLRQNRFRSVTNTEAVFKAGTFSAVSKTGLPVRSDPAMRKYRELFEHEFSGESRLLDIAAPACAAAGLPLGIKTVPPKEAIAILTGGAAAAVTELSPDKAAVFQKEKISAFIRDEIKTLKLLRDILTGEAVYENRQLEELLDASDYIWAHFPDCAGAGGRRPAGTDLAFLKRVRIEIEPFLKLWERSLAELN